MINDSSGRQYEHGVANISTRTYLDGGDTTKQHRQKWDRWKYEPNYSGQVHHKRLHWNIQNASEFDQYLRDNNISASNTIIISTDGSLKIIDGQKHAGLGIYITYNGKQYSFAQGIGCQEILHAELRALVTSFHLIRKLGLPIDTTPICLITDNKTCFDYYFGHGNFDQNTPLPNLATEFNDLAHKYDVTLLKVPSHEDRYGRPTIELNDKADKLAEMGREASASNNQITLPKHYLGTYHSLSDHAHLDHSQSDQHLRYDPITILWYHTQNVALHVSSNHSGVMTV